MISATFQRISLSPVHDKSLSLLTSSASPSIIYPSLHSPDDSLPSFCSYQSYDDVCIVTANINSSPMSYPNVTLLSSLPKNRTSSTRLTSRSTFLFSPATPSYLDFNSSLSRSSNLSGNSTDMYDDPSLIVSVATSPRTSFLRRFRWQRIWIFLVPILCGIILCILVAVLGYIKYRRKDVGVYEVEEAQRFRPLIVQLAPSPGEHHQESLDPTNVSTTAPAATTVAKQDLVKSHKTRRRKKSLVSADEQREFYI